MSAGADLGVFGGWGRSVCVRFVLGEGVRGRVEVSGAALRSCQKPEMFNGDTKVLAV
jgi:hypothetical protein